MSAPLVLMMAGGTGGHVYPALAVAVELQARGYQLEWLGTDRGLEARAVPAAGFSLHTLPVRGLRGKSALWKIAGLFSLMGAAVQALLLVRRLAPACVVGMGGYVAGPGGVAARLLGIPLLIHEQNSVAGTTNRMLAPLAKKVVAGFPAAFATDIDCEVVGNPVRRELLQSGAAAVYDFAGQRPLRLLVIGGSLGARALNDVVPEAILQILDQGAAGSIEVWHQTGESHIEVVREAYGEALAHGVRATAFIDDMAQAYSWADLVLCRAGALTVTELAIMGRPAILVPLPQAIDDHQTANARSLADCGAAILLRQEKLSSAGLVESLQAYMAHPKRLAVMAAAAAGAAIPKATDRVCDYCEELINGC